MDPKQLMHLLLLAHLSGVARGIHHAGSQGAPQGQQGGKAQPQQAQRPKQNPKMQGRAGMAQGRHGAKGPIMGGVGSLQNANGMHPHQTNPQAFALKALGGAG